MSCHASSLPDAIYPPLDCVDARGLYDEKEPSECRFVQCSAVPVIDACQTCLTLRWAAKEGIVPNVCQPRMHACEAGVLPDSTAKRDARLSCRAASPSAMRGPGVPHFFVKLYDRLGGG